MGRPRNPNRPPAEKPVRLTKRAFQKMQKLHIGNEPYGMTLERLMDQLDELRKKVKVLDLDIEGLSAELRTKDLANTNLINILRRRDGEIDRLKQERRKLNDDTIQESK